MLDHEYQRTIQTKNYKRSWSLTVIASILFVLVVAGIIGIWRYVGHDGFIIATVIIPAGLCGVMFLLAALNGRRKSLRDAFEVILSFVYWW